MRPRPWGVGLALAGLAMLIACNGGDDARVHDQSALDFIDDLQQLKHTPKSCKATDECPVGSHCDAATGHCDWECRNDRECHDGKTCNAVGTCVAATVSFRANNSGTCTTLTVSARRTALLDLAAADVDHQISCADATICPCGSYCDRERGAICRVECLPAELADPPPPPELGLGCGTGQVCSPLGQCIAGDSGTPPPVRTHTIDITPAAVTANTATAPSVVQVQVALTTDDLSEAMTQDPTKVVISIDGPRVDGQPRPRLKCASDAALADGCTLGGNWQFDLTQGKLRSAPRPVWVEIPRGIDRNGDGVLDHLDRAEWTVTAQSNLSSAASHLAVESAPEAFPATAPGHYTGTIAFVIGDEGSASPHNRSLPITAEVTTAHVALFEPTRVLLPAGHVVVRRDATYRTVLPWLTTALADGTSSTYNVQIHEVSSSYNAATGRFDQVIAFTDGTGRPDFEATVTLQRDGNAQAKACTADSDCASGSHCEVASDMKYCLPGAAPAGTVTQSAEPPAATMTSRRLTDWQPTLTTLVNGNLALGGTGVQGWERAYCFDTSIQTTPAQFGVTAGLHPESRDFRCKIGAQAEFAQSTFAFANRSTEVQVDNQGAITFDLVKECLTDLKASPTDNPLGARPCASLGRFFLALRANVSNGVGQPQPLLGQRLVNQLLRQWLNVNAYTASSAVQVRDYDDALSASGTAAFERLGDALDLVDQGLRVLLDARVRPQYHSGPDLALATAYPDYRNADAQLRWSFNGVNPQIASNGDNSLLGGGTYTGSTMSCNHTADLTSASPVQIDGDDTRFTVVVAPTFFAYPGTTSASFPLFRKGGGSASDDVVLAAQVNNAGTTSPSLSLELRNGANTFVVDFDPIPAAGPEPIWGQLAVIADGGTYRVYRYRSDLGTSVYAGRVVRGGPLHWGASGAISLTCSLPQADVCSSWDLYVPGDKLGVWVQDFAQTGTYVITGVPGTSQQDCIDRAAQFRTTLMNQAAADGAPAWAYNQIGVTSGGIVIVSDKTECERETRHCTTWRTFQCPFTITKHPIKSLWSKPSCGSTTGSPYTQNGFSYDELALWPRALTSTEFAVMAARYAGIPTNDATGPSSTATEQPTGLPAHILEAASADLDLLGEYIAAERGAVYGECIAGGASPARDRMLDRVGRNVRLVRVLEREAADLAALAGVSGAAWYPRYTAARQQLAGRRTRVLEALDRALACKNPLDIGEEDIPMFTGEAVGDTDKFFASTHYLVARATTNPGGLPGPLVQAQNELASAQSAYKERRASVYQNQLTETQRSQRMSDLRADFEGPLRKLCGTLPSGRSLLDELRSGTLDGARCFIKSDAEKAGCSAAAGKPPGEIPAECLRGELGDKVLTIQAAETDSVNAVHDHDRATDIYDAKIDYCVRIAQFNGVTTKIAEKHLAHMAELRAERRDLGWLQTAVHMVSNTIASQQISPAMIGFDLWVRSKLENLEEDEVTEEARYNEVLRERAGDKNVMDCYQDAALTKKAIDAAADMMKRTAQSATAAKVSFDSAQENIRGLVEEASGRLALEARVGAAPPPQFHYWLQSHIEEYHRQMAHARRVLYLAVRAYEYENLNRLDPEKRSKVLTAARPEQLTEVVGTLNDATAPGFTGMHPTPAAPVLSLLTDILRLPDLSTANLPPGRPRQTPVQQLRDYLRSESAKVYDSFGNLIGRGVRFTLVPGGFSETSCAERIWRITTSLQVNNAGHFPQHTVLLRQTNAFGSQQCGAPERKTVVRSRMRLAGNLLTGDGPTSFTQPRAFDSVNVDGPLNKSGDELRSLTSFPGGFVSGFAGHGLYGDYTLVFPIERFPDNLLDEITDVWFRFDTVELTND